MGEGELPLEGTSFNTNSESVLWTKITDHGGLSGMYSHPILVSSGAIDEFSIRIIHNMAA